MNTWARAPDIIFGCISFGGASLYNCPNLRRPVRSGTLDFRSWMWYEVQNVYKSGLDCVLHLWRLLHNMPPRIDTRNTYYLRNVYNQQYVNVSGSASVIPGAKVENTSHQVRIESPYPFSCRRDNSWRWLCSGSSSQPDPGLLIISFRISEMVSTWLFKERAMLVITVDGTMSALQQSIVPGRFLGIPPLLRLSKSFVLPPLLLLIRAIDI